MNELAFYTLAGAPQTPRELIDEVRQAELQPILQAYRKARPAGRFDGLVPNPAGQ
jgi:hypothetical protein